MVNNQRLVIFKDSQWLLNIILDLDECLILIGDGLDLELLESENIFELDLDSIKKEADKILEDFNKKYKDFLPEEDLDSEK